jgi:hypothetical protein
MKYDIKPALLSCPYSFPNLDDYETRKQELDNILAPPHRTYKNRV